MPDATFVRPDLGAFCRLDELGLEVFGQRLEPERAVLACRVAPSEFDRWSRGCGGEGVPRDTVTRTLAHEPFGWRPTTLLVTIRRYRCGNCRRVWRQDTARAAEPRARLSRTALRWALQAIVVQHLTIARVAEALAVTWDTANDAVLAEGRRVLIDDVHRLDGVRVIGVDEHCWRHTRRGDKYVTVIIDLTPVRDGTGPARLLDMVEGRSKQVFTTWLDDQSRAFREGIEVVAMDGFTGFKTAAAEVVPDAVAVMDPFHVVALAGDALDRCRQRVQQQTRGHRGRKGDPLYGIRRALRTGADLLTARQSNRIDVVFADERHVEVEITWTVYQRIVAAYRDPDRARAKNALKAVIASISRRVPAELLELVTLAERCTDGPATCWPTSTAPAPATARPRRSTAVWNTSAAPPSASATSPTTSPDHCSRPADSDHDYTVNPDEPQKARNFQRYSRVAVAISDPKNPAVFTQVRGRVVNMTSQGGEESINALAHKYTGKPYAWYGGHKQTRLVVTVEADRITPVP